MDQEHVGKIFFINFFTSSLFTGMKVSVPEAATGTWNSIKDRKKRHLVVSKGCIIYIDLIYILISIYI